MLELAQRYATLKRTKILAHRIAGKEITFVLSSGPKLTMTETELKLAIEKMQADAAADGAQIEPSAPLKSASARKSANAHKTKEN